MPILWVVRKLKEFLMYSGYKSFTGDTYVLQILSLSLELIFLLTGVFQRAEVLNDDI